MKRFHFHFNFMTDRTGRDRIARAKKAAPALCAAVSFCLLAVSLVLFCGGMTARAETGQAGGAASWHKASGEGQAELSVQITHQTGLGDITAIQVNIALAAEKLPDAASVNFTFDSGWGSGLIRAFTYDESRGLLTVVIAGNERIMEQSGVRKVGTLAVRGGDNLHAVVDGGDIVADGRLYHIVFAQNSDVWLYGSRESSGENWGGGGSGSGSSGGGSGSSGSWGGSSGGSWGGSSGSGGSRPSGSGSGGVYQVPSAQGVETPGSWEQSGSQWKFKLASGAYARSTWILKGGQWYHIGSGSIMDTGWYQQENGVWYYLASDGHMKKGWQKIDQVWYYLSEDNGQMKVGWLYQGNWWYYLSPSGAMCTGWQQLAGDWYYFSTGEASSADQRPEGAMYAGTTTPDGYAVDSTGVYRQGGTGQTAAPGSSAPGVTGQTAAPPAGGSRSAASSAPGGSVQGSVPAPGSSAPDVTGQTEAPGSSAPGVTGQTAQPPGSSAPGGTDPAAPPSSGSVPKNPMVP